MRKILIIFLLSFLARSAFAISADISQIGIGARPLSLGSAFTALSDDGSALFTNPAGLCGKHGLQVVSMAGQLLEDVSYVVLGLNTPSPMGQLGIGYVNAATGGIPLTTLTRTPTLDVVTQTDSTDYYSSIISLVYGRQLFSSLAAGGSLKFYSQGFSNVSGNMSGATGSGMDLDLGLKWAPNSMLNLGLVTQNILPAAMGGKFVWVKNSVEEGIPAVIKLGANLKVYPRDQEVNVTLDSEMKPAQNRPGLWHAGIEWWPLNSLSLRMGLDQAAKAAESGVGVDNNLTAGLGLKLKDFTFDYAYHSFGDLQENNTHFFSFGFSGLDRPRIVPAATKPGDQPKKEPPYINSQSLNPLLLTFEDVPEGYWAREPIMHLGTLGIMSGYPDGSFKPDQLLTRAELAAMLVKAKGFVAATEKVPASRFYDVAVTNWAAPYIEKAVERKYVTGYPDQTFKPNKTVTRAEGVTIVSRFAGLKEIASINSKPFPDVPVDYWAAGYITSAKLAGLLEYLAGKNFEPELPLTRAEAAEIISKTKFAKEKIRGLIKNGE